MRLRGMFYTDGDKSHDVDRFLSKVELRKIFPEAEYVTLHLHMHRMRFRRKGGSSSIEGGKKSQKKGKKKGYSEKPKSPYTRLRHKIVWLGI